MNLSRGKQKRKENKGRKILIITAIIAVTIIVGVVIVSSSFYTNHIQAENNKNVHTKDGGSTGLLQQQQQQVPFSISTLTKQGSPVLSKNPSAPITLAEFGDFQCPFCDRFAKETEPQINQTYIQTGKLNMAFKDFTIYGPDSKTAAMAAQCTNDQGKFWNYYKILYNNQGPENSGWASKDNLKRFASQIPGLNMHEFNSCLDDEKYKSVVENDLAFGYSLGLRGTPSFIIVNNNGSKPELIDGAYPFSVFKEIIDKKMAVARG